MNASTQPRIREKSYSHVHTNNWNWDAEEEDDFHGGKQTKNATSTTKEGETRETRPRASMENRGGADTAAGMQQKLTKRLAQARGMVAELTPDEKQALVRELVAEFIAQAEDPRTHRKPYRKRADVGNDKPMNANINRTKKQAGLRLEPKILEKAAQDAKQAGLPRNTYLETVITIAIQ